MGSNMTTDHPPPPPGGSAEAATGGPRPVLLALKALRFVTVLGIASLLFASATFLLYGVVETVRYVTRLGSVSA
jgi:hypothetical protein